MKRTALAPAAAPPAAPPGKLPTPKLTGKAAELDRLEVEHFARTVVSCPDCGVLCRRYLGTDWDGELFDVHRSYWETRLVPAVGLDQVLRQGVGVGNGGRHVCPPTRNLTGDVLALGGKAVAS